MLWIVGRTFSELERYLSQHAISFGLLKDSKFPRQKSIADQVLDVNFSDPQSLLESLRDKSFAPTGFIVSGYEQYVWWVAWLANHYGLPGPSLQAAVAATDKQIMRTAFWDKANDIAPQWRTIYSIADLEHFASTHDYPLVLKPSNLSKSRYISINNNWEDLTSNYILSSQALVSQNTDFLVEEFLEGSMHTIAGFVDMQGNVNLSDIVVDCIRANDRDMDDSYIAERIIPSALSTVVIGRLQDVARRGVAALELRGVALHIELMFDGRSAKIIEIAARIGGYRSQMYELAAGIDLYGGLVATCQNLPYQMISSLQKFCSVIEIFPTTNGVVRQLNGIDVLQSIPNVHQLRLKHAVGKYAGRAKDGHKAVAIITITADTSEELQQVTQMIYDVVSVTVEPSP